MPKIIDAAGGKILQAAKHILFEQGYSALSVRQVAKDCGVAVGTIYNYFQNKDTLIAHIMLEDWAVATQQMELACEQAKSIAQGMIGIYDALADFASIYNTLWQQFSQKSGSADVVGGRHLLIRKQLEANIVILLTQHDRMQDSTFAPLLAEMLLSAVMQPDISCGDVETFVNRIFK